jgi:cell division septation protein DedD
MKKIAIALAALLILVGFAGWNVWHAVYAPVTTTPSLVEQGSRQLHAQFEQAKARESEIEQQDWSSIPLLRGLIQAHQHRIDQLNGNSQAGEILAHDRDAIARINQRIVDLQAQQAQQAALASPEANPSVDASGQPAQNPKPAAPAPTPKTTPATQPAPSPSNPAARRPLNPTPKS